MADLSVEEIAAIVARCAKDRPRIFFDTEFIEDGQTIELISIGLVRDDGAELYLCNRDAALYRASQWVRDNVLPHLPERTDDAWCSHAEIADRVRAFSLERPKPQFWAYYADYDWVALCQLYGRMIDLPKGFPMYCMDLKQWSVMLGDPTHPKQTSGEHHALADARWNRDLYDFLHSRTDVPRLAAMAQQYLKLRARIDDWATDIEAHGWRVGVEHALRDMLAEEK